MANPPSNYYDNLLQEDWKKFLADLDDMDMEMEWLNDPEKPQVCPKTGRKLTYDKHTGEALDAETLIPIDNFVDFTNKPIL